MKKLTFITLALFAATICSAKVGSIKRASDLSKKDFQEVIEHCEDKLPKFWAALTSIRSQGVNVRITKEKKMGPGKASGTDKIVLSSWFLTNDLPRFPEDRLIIVLFHEFGHILFNREKPKSKRSPEEHELAAFSYSLIMAKKLATKGDYGPLEQVLKNLETRSKRGKPKDPHTIALKQLVGGSLWNECADLLRRHSQD